MQANNRQNRNSISFTPQPMKRNDLESRRSVSSLNLDRSERTSNDILFDTLMSDPAKRAMVLHMLSQERENIERYKQKENKKRVIKLKQMKNTERLLHCESPTALLRRRALEKHRRDSDSSSTSDSKSIKSSVPFERLLRGVVAYVEIRSKEGDRSAGAKALMLAMGATVKDCFTSEVTHVVFKDGSFSTYQKAKLMKVHLVSVLWLETIRKNKFWVPEKNYPALGTESFDVNISMICQDYEKVVNEELRRSLAVGFPSNARDGSIKSRKTALPTELKTIQEHTVLPFSIPGVRLSDVFVPTSQDWEAQSVISCGSGTLPLKRTTGTVHEELSDRLGDSTPELTSDDDSDCGVINGHSFKRDSILSDLDLDLIENTAVNTAVPALNTADMPDLPGINVSANTTSSSRSVSLLSRKSSAHKKLSYDKVMLVDMDLTKNLVEADVDKENMKCRKTESRSLFKRNKEDSGLLANNSTNLLDEISKTNSKLNKNRSNKKSNACSSNSGERSTRKNSYEYLLPGSDEKFKQLHVSLTHNLRKYHSSENLLSRISSDNSGLKRSTRSTDDLTGKKQTQKKVSVSSDEMSSLRISPSSNDTSEKIKKSSSIHMAGERVEITDANIYRLNNDEMSPLQISATNSSNDASGQIKKKHHNSGKKNGIHNHNQNQNQRTSSEEMSALRISTSISLNDTPGQTKTYNLRSSGEIVETQPAGKNKDKSLESDTMSPLQISCSSSDVSQHHKNQSSSEYRNRQVSGELQIEETEDKSSKILSDELSKRKKGSKSLPETIQLQKDESDVNSKRKTRLRSSKCGTQIPEKDEKQIGRSRSLNSDRVNEPSKLSSVEKRKNGKSPKVSPEMTQKWKSLKSHSADSKGKIEKTKSRRTLRSDSLINENMSFSTSTGDSNNTREKQNKEGLKDEDILASLSNGQNNVKQRDDSGTMLKPKTRKSVQPLNKHTNHANNNNELTNDSSEISNHSERNSKSSSKTKTPDLKSAVAVNDLNNTSATSGNTSSTSIDRGLCDQSEDNNTTSNSDFLQNRKPQNENNITVNKQNSKSKKDGNKKGTVTKGENKVFRKLYNPNQSVEDTLKNFEWACNTETSNEFSTTTVTNSVTTVTNLATTVTYVVSKKPSAVPLMPILITPAAKKLLDNRGKKVPKVKKQKVTKKEKALSKPPKNVYLNSSKDEQKELTDEYVNKTSKRKLDVEEESPGKKRAIQISRRRSRRVSQSEKLRFRENSSQSEMSDGNPILPDLNRRSTFEFVEMSAKSTKKTKQKSGKKKSSIVCTRMHKPEVQTFMQIVKKLGCFFVEDEVSDQTTHLVVGEPKRTINLLKAVARGCWILKHEWLFRSLEAQKWLPEEDFEVTEFSPAVQQCRVERQAFGPYYSMDIFANCGPIYISRNSVPRRSDLEALVRLCKGTITDIAYNASIVVGDWVRYENLTCVTEMWVLDSITFKKCRSFKKYYFKQDL